MGPLTQVRSRNGCGELDLGGVVLYEVPGDHHSILEEPHVERLAVLLQQDLE